MTRHRSFETAAARRKSDPIVWEIDGATVRLRPSVGLADLADVIDSLQAEPEEGLSPMRAAVARRTTLIDCLRKFIVPDDLDQIAEIEDDLDAVILSEMLSELIAEYAGSKNPTKPSSSSVGSEPTGEISTAGADPEASTPSA